MEVKYFLTKKQFKLFVELIVFMILMLVIEKMCDYRYLMNQKLVQEGNMEAWYEYLTSGVVNAVISAFNTLMGIFMMMWVVKVQKINFFQQYNGIIQTGKKLMCLDEFNYENTKLITIVDCLMAVISICYTILVMNIVKMTVPQLIGAGCIMVVGIVLGARRGKLQKAFEHISSSIQVHQELLTNHFMISANVLDNHLSEIEKLYWKQIRTQILKNSIICLPGVIKVIVFLALLWNIPTLKLESGNTHYSYSYVILTSYGYIVVVANSIGNIIEHISKVVEYYKDNGRKSLIKDVKKNQELIQKQKRNIALSNVGLIIRKSFTANVRHSDRCDSWYQVPNELMVKKGEMILLEGENETGKSRFNRLIMQVLPNTIMYDANTAISNRLAENFYINGEVDFRLVKILANGLGIDGRIPNLEEEFRNVQFKEQLNSADLQRLIALQILYFATKEHENASTETQIVILDEILANISEVNAEKVMAFMNQILKELGVCTIIVSHTHKDIVKKYVDQTWVMRNQKDKIVIMAKD